MILARGPEIDLANVSQQVLKPAQGSIAVGAPVTLEQLEAEHIRRIVSGVSTMERAAEILGIDPSTLFRRRKRGL